MAEKRFPLSVPIALVILLSVANGVADYWHLYYIIWWLDIPMHVLGGSSVAFAALALYFRTKRARRGEETALFVWLLAIASALTIGLGWEIYEYVIDRVVAAYGDQLGDTIKDLFDDLIGGMVAAWVFLRAGYLDAAAEGSRAREKML